MRPALSDLARDSGLVLLEGKRVLELSPPGGGKGVVVRELIEEVGAAAALYAGDDIAELEAFAMLDH